MGARGPGGSGSLDENGGQITFPGGASNMPAKTWSTMLSWNDSRIISPYWCTICGDYRPRGKGGVSGGVLYRRMIGHQWPRPRGLGAATKS
jgi:hypothetical protein